MANVKLVSDRYLGRNFIPEKYLPGGKDEYHLRDSQNFRPEGYWRNLKSEEIERLVKNGNTCDNWDDFLVTDRFNPRLISNSQFFGLVRIGRLEEAILEYHDLQVPAGITNCRIISCDIGDDNAVHNVNYMAYYITGNKCILLNIDEIHTTNYAKFGNGIVKEGEEERVRVWLDLMNETGARRVVPFDGMITADAYIWAKYREDKSLMERLLQLTQSSFSAKRGFYGTIGDHCVIKHCLIIKDVKIGGHCYIKGANKLKNLTINSNEEEPTQVGEGVELVNGIVGLGCHIFYGAKAVRFIMGNNSNLKYGARLLNSFLGDNSTVSCCEMLNNLIFPAHEQHHNNSFLISTLVMGQSNMAAGVTVGSNHNSRANDGEIQAGRGFWPGLCTSVKHSCRFASFLLLSKADYPAELNIPLPFALLNNNAAADRLELMPAFWWRHNMFALARNTWKFQTRDKRKTKVQNVEFDSLAPDTAEELLEGRRLLALWTGKAALRKEGIGLSSLSEQKIIEKGRALLNGDAAAVDSLEIFGENMEKSRRKVIIIQAREGYKAYGEMLHYYAAKNLIAYMEENEKASLKSMCAVLSGPRVREWVNLGGQLVQQGELEGLFTDIRSGKLNTWTEIHRAYDRLWEAYRLNKQKHALAVLVEIQETVSLDKARWIAALNRAVEIQEVVRDRVFESRKKDYENPFRQATFRNAEEMKAAIGTAEENSFVKQVRAETEDFRKRVEEIKGRG